MKNVGVIGTGQLCMMLGDAAGKLGGISLHALGRVGDPADFSSGRITITPFSYGVSQALKWARSMDVVTIETENIDIGLLNAIAGLGVRIAPGIGAIKTAQDRVLEKEFFKDQGISCADFMRVESGGDLDLAFSKIGPGILKTRRFGYDGLGQIRINAKENLAAGYELCERNSGNLIYEGLVDFAFEVSKIGAFSNGDISMLPLAKNTHRRGILISSVAPYVDKALEEMAERYLKRISLKLDYIGVLSVEFFVTRDGSLMANEIAPRVHNSGHWSISGAAYSQFDLHLMAILGMSFPVNKTKRTGMLNILGTMPDKEELTHSGGVLFDYHKTARHGRKLGHLNFDLTTENAEDNFATMQAVSAAWPGERADRKD